MYYIFAYSIILYKLRKIMNYYFFKLFSIGYLLSALAQNKSVKH
jgi:hypothetical protein